MKRYVAKIEKVGYNGKPYTLFIGKDFKKIGAFNYCGINHAPYDEALMKYGYTNLTALEKAITWMKKYTMFKDSTITVETFEA